MRLFIGIPLSGEVVEQLEELVSSLRRPGDGLRWSKPESWHITLQFLGNTSAQQHACIVPRLRGVIASPFSIQLEGIAFFDRAGVFFAGIQVSPELQSLQKSVTAATAPCGFAPEDRPYHPHITLARNKGQSNGIRKLRDHVPASPSFASFDATEFLLYESFLGPTGSRYEVRDHFPFAPSPSSEQLRAEG